MGYKTIVERYSLESGEVGKIISNEEHEYADGKSALIALDHAMKRTVGGAKFIVELPDGRHVPFDEAYSEVFGVSPVKRDNRTNLYPKLK